MSISLSKGQKVDLTKGNPTFSNIMVALGWDPVQQNSSGGKGLFGGIFGGGSSNAPQIDCDSSIIMIGQSGKFENQKDLIYYGNLKSEDGSVIHAGDNLTGSGQGDDEQIMIDLKKIPARITKLIFVVNIYKCVDRKQHFGMIKNAFIRIVDQSNNKEFLRYNLTDDYSGKTALITGEIYRYGNEWKFSAIGEGTNDPSLSELVKRYV